MAWHSGQPRVQETLPLAPTSKGGFTPPVNCTTKFNTCQHFCHSTSRHDKKRFYHPSDLTALFREICPLSNRRPAIVQKGPRSLLRKLQKAYQVQLLTSISQTARRDAVERVSHLVTKQSCPFPSKARIMVSNPSDPHPHIMGGFFWMDAFFLTHEFSRLKLPPNAAPTKNMPNPSKSAWASPSRASRRRKPKSLPSGLPLLVRPIPLILASSDQI